MGAGGVPPSHRGVRVLDSPPATEGFGCVVKESPSTGNPVLAGSVGGVREAVGSGGRMVACDAGWNSSVLRKRVITCFAGAERRPVAKAAKGFSWQEVALKEIRMLQEAVKRPQDP